MKRKIKITLVIIALLLAALAAAVYFTVRSEAERRLIAELNANGFTVKSLSMDQLGTSGVVISDVEISKPALFGAERIEARPDNTLRVTGAYFQTGKGERFVADFEGTYMLNIPERSFSLSGEAKGASHPFTAKLALTHSMRSKETQLSVTDALLNWAGGHILAGDVKVNFPLSQPVTIPLTIKNVSLDALLKLGLSPTAAAEGAASGTVPLIIKPDGNFSIGSGTLSAAGGVVRIPAGSLPSEGELATLANVLNDFHFTLLAIEFLPAPEGELAVRLRLEGNNPAAYDGKPVKLNVNLRGDVLQFLQFTVLPLADPTRLLQKETP